MSAESEFLAEIIANPRDLTPRLIYADWLEENGDPRGEFIRIQCELAEPSEDYDRRERLGERQDQLLRQYEQNWTEPFKDYVDAWGFGCGLIEFLHLKIGSFLEHQEMITKCFPLRSLRLIAPDYHRKEEFDPQHLAACQTMKNIEELSVCGTWRASDVKGLANAPLINLSVLNVDRGFDDASFKPLFNLNAPKLRKLILANNRLGEGTLQSIAEESVFGDLNELDLTGINITEPFTVALVESDNFKNLKHLTVSEWQIAPHALAHLFERFGTGLNLA